MLDHEFGQRDRPLSGFGGMLYTVTQWFAMAGGFLLLAVVLMTTLSVAGRYLFSLPIPGDYEITEFLCGIATLLFFPYCEMSMSNIKAEFFTDALRTRWKQLLNFIGELLFAVVASLLAWRFVIGGMSRMSDGQVYMHLNIPYWWGYVPGAIAMALLLIVCLWRAADCYRQLITAEAA